MAIAAAASVARLSGSCAAQSLTMLMAPEVETSDKSSAATDVAPSDDSVVVVRRVAEADLLGVGRKGFDGDGNEPCLVAARSFVPKPCAVQGASLETPNANEWNFLAKAILAAVVCDGFGEEVARQWGFDCLTWAKNKGAVRQSCDSRSGGRTVPSRFRTMEWTKSVSKQRTLSFSRVRLVIRVLDGVD